jgi:hypothetical protein
MLRIPYKKEMKSAARRHLKAGQVLYGEASAGAQPGCLAVAGYLFGIAGELALKEMMRDSGIRPLPRAERRGDPYYAHFPELKSMLTTAPGRRAGDLRKFSEDPRLFQNWGTDMRYAPTDEVNANWVTDWKATAEKLVDKMVIG